MHKGDVIVIPAGYAHAMLQDTSGGGDNGGKFSMVGSYPIGAAQWDHQTEEVGEEGEGRMRELGWFERDPVYGDEGPVLGA